MGIETGELEKGNDGLWVWQAQGLIHKSRLPPKDLPAVQPMGSRHSKTSVTVAVPPLSESPTLQVLMSHLSQATPVSKAFPAICLHTHSAQSTPTSASVPQWSWMEEYGGVVDAREIVRVPSLLAQPGKINLSTFTPSILNLSLSPWENRLWSEDFFFFLPPPSSISNVKQIEASSEGLKN